MFNSGFRILMDMKDGFAMFRYSAFEMIVCDRIRENKYQTVVVRSHVALDAFNDRGDHDVKLPVPSDVELDKLFLVKKFSDDLPKLFLYLPKMIYLFMPYKSNSENVQYIPLNKRSAAPKWNDAP